jgi:hypothetical protein
MREGKSGREKEEGKSEKAGVSSVSSVFPPKHTLTKTIPNNT